MNSLSNKRNDAGVRDKLIFLFAAVSFCFPKAGTATAGLPLTVSMFLFLSALLANAKELTKKRFTLAYEMNKKSVIENISYSFSSNVLSLLLGILATLLFPKFLGVAGYGYYQLYIFYTGYTLITALGIADGVQLKIAGKEYNQLDFDEQSGLFWLSTVTQVSLYAVVLILCALFIGGADKRLR